MGDLNNRILFSHCSGCQKSKMKVLAGLVSSDTHLLPLLCPHVVFPLGLHIPTISGCPNFFFFTGVWTQGLTLAREVLHCLSHASSPFCFSYFSDRVSCFGRGLAFDPNPSTYYFCIAGITPSLLAEIGVSLTFCQGWPWTTILPISTSWVAGITNFLFLWRHQSNLIGAHSNGLIFIYSPFWGLYFEIVTLRY
jgi:hypothetical protein